MSWNVLITSGLISAFVAALVAVLTTERNIQMKNVTQERAKWRAKMKAKAVEVHQSALTNNVEKLDELRLEFSLNLNPLDKEDNAILKVIDKLKESANTEQNLWEFSERLSLLLKHDWERAKYEASFWEKFKGLGDPSDLLPPKRTKYTEFKQKQGNEDSAALTVRLPVFTPLKPEVMPSEHDRKALEHRD